MNVNSYKKKILLLILVITVLLINACSTFSVKSSEDFLRQRVEGFMNAKISNDWLAVYEYLEPSYQEMVSQKNFIQRSRSVRFNNYSIGIFAILDSGKDATVEVTYSATMKGMDFKDNREIQRWVRINNDWFVTIPPADSSHIFQ